MMFNADERGGFQKTKKSQKSEEFKHRDPKRDKSRKQDYTANRNKKREVLE